MNKADLIDALEVKLGSRQAANDAVNVVVDTIVRAVTKGERVAISGFGSFEKVQRAARTGRNPRTGETVRIRKTSVPRFKPGNAFKGFVAAPRSLPKTSVGDLPVTARSSAGSEAAPKKAAAKKTAKKAAPKKAAAKKAVKKAAPKKATAKKAAPKKAAAKKATVKKAVARKAVAKKAPARKAATKKAAVTRKAAAKRAPARRAVKSVAKKTTTRGRKVATSRKKG